MTFTNINSGLGFSVAEALVENGCTVIVSSSNEGKVKQTVERLSKAYPSASSQISGQACNLGDESALESNIATLFEKVGKLDHVVFTAGDSLAVKSVAETDFAFFKQAGMVRFFAPFFVAKHAVKYLSGGPKSSITLTTGAICERPMPDWTVINAYMTGMTGMTRNLALDLKPIRVNIVSPGAVNTELWANAGFSEEQKQSFMEEHGKKMPTGKVCGPEEVAEAYLYLLRDHNVTGTKVSTTGGAMLV